MSHWRCTPRVPEESVLGNWDTEGGEGSKISEYNDGVVLEWFFMDF